ncbi:MAG: dTDP-4-dehydrorhamnose 3,5-epimerase [Bacteroidales bacterium]|jgi:dTDP-4-dehydrorhamnose 3,5-epimerase|nr:dTDP-4-dehydrorhamnose 3,5-epimerase [Bacteroidales bacterium]
MNFIKTDIDGVYIIEPKVFEDERGYFFESFRHDEFQKHIGEVNFIQDNESRSSYGVLRGLHYQKLPFAQAKLVRVVHGRVLDVAVDIRKDSPTFGQHVAVELSHQNKLQFYIPRGFAHGFAVLSEDGAIFQYKCDNYYAQQSEAGIAWNDADIDIEWRLPDAAIILSDKDKINPFLREIEPVDL